MRAALLLATLALAGCLSPEALDGGAGEPVRYQGVEVETRLGSFTAILFPDETPATTAFFTGLVESGYYDGRQFGRVIPGFVIQEVDRTGGTTDQQEKVVGEFGTNVSFSAGAFGIARDADPDSGGSEFFVMDFATSRLYGNYTAFAQVVEGMEVVHAIARVQAVKTGPASSVVASPPGSPVYFGLHDRVPVDPVVMTRVRLVDVELDAATAARYPLQVGETYATPTHRATLEWPRDLAAGRESALAWYVSNRDASPTAAANAQDVPDFDSAGATLRYDGAASGTLAFSDTPEAPGALQIRWTPPVPGSYQFHLERDGAQIALANLTVEP